LDPDDEEAVFNEAPEGRPPLWISTVSHVSSVALMANVVDWPGTKHAGRELGSDESGKLENTGCGLDLHVPPEQHWELLEHELHVLPPQPEHDLGGADCTIMMKSIMTRDRPSEMTTAVQYRPNALGVFQVTRPLPLLILSPDGCEEPPYSLEEASRHVKVSASESRAGTYHLFV
jgi:hypothetical protein